MRAFTFAAGLLSLVSTAFGSSDSTSEVAVPATFQPPQVFKNANLVHIISLEKNYAKEQINVLIENIDNEPQDEYYLPFTADQMSRVGGLEVKDRKDDEAGPFVVEAVEIDQESDIQYYRIRLPAPLKAGGQQTLGISYYYLKAYTPLPASIAQDEAQFLVYDFSAYCPSAYTTTKQKTEVKVHSTNVASYTKIPGSGEAAESPQVQGSKLTYGPFDEQPAGAVLPANVRFEFSKPVNHVASLERDVEVSHWGGNAAFEERYTLYHLGAKLSGPFSRLGWAQQQHLGGSPTSALKELRFPLRVGSLSPYYTDTIGNVSTSKFRSSKREVVLETKPRYPVFGGWKYPFTIGWNADAKNFVRATADGSYVLNVPFMEGPKQPEGVEYEQVTLRILLPEGAENVKFYTNIPSSSITEASVGITRTYLDTVGRTSVTIKAQNLVDEFRDREVYVSYDYSTTSALRKPVVIFSSVLLLFVAGWAIGGLDVGFSTVK
ncbi:hypothetical protein ACRALDRAFT_1081766 [Sodiomyces alcalophilus JCM 7366]|uniref:uncharacterized protein n=1 Tax=Sodiomyces alcalophilus JCM 7366 TaxID=591952 RepID=UPI0039B3D172